MDAFDAAAYREGYAWAESLIDTYGPEHTRLMKPAPWRSGDWVLGFNTCIGVTLERQLQG